MIIGVDESGDFSAGTRGFYVSAFVRSSELDEVVVAHRAWERDVRRDLGLQGELKGHAVTEAWALRFVHEVMRATEFGVRYRAFAVDATSENLCAMEAQRSILIAGYEEYAQDVANDPEPTVRRHATTWRSRAEWVAALKPPRLLRLATLMTTLPEMLELASEPVKAFETSSQDSLCASLLMVGLLIQAAAGSLGGVGRRFPNRQGLAV